MYGGLSVDQVFEKARQAGIPDDYTYRRVATEMATQRRTSAAASQATLPAPKPKGFVRSAIEAVTKPAIDYAKFIGTGLIQAPVLAATGGRVNIPISSERELQEMSGETLGERLFKTGKKGAKATAGAMSYLVPGGGAAKAMAARGALTGGLYGYSQDQPIVESAAAGAVGGVAVPKILGVARKLFEKVGGAGTAMRTGVVAPKVPASPFMAEEEMAIQQGLEGLGLKGSAAQQKAAMPGAFRQLDDQINALLKTRPMAVNRATVRSRIATAFNEMINYDATIPAYKKAGDKFMGQVSKTIADKGGNALGVREAKRSLGRQLSRAFDKLDKGVPLTEKEEVGMAVWGALDDLLPAEVKKLSRMQSVLYKASPGIQKQAAAKVRIPVLGSELPAGGVQQAYDVTGRAMQKVGKLGKAIPELGLEGPTVLGKKMPGALEFVGRRQFVGQKPSESEIEGSRDRVIKGLMEQGVVEPEEIKSILDQGEPGGSDFTLQEVKDRMENVMAYAPAEEVVPETPTGLGLPGLTRERAIALMLKYPKKQALIQNIYKMYNPPVSAMTQGKVEDAEAGLRLLGRLKGAYEEVQGAGLTAGGPGLFGEGRLAGLKGTAASISQRSPEAAAYTRSVDAFMSRLSRAAGEKGVLTDQDIKRIRKAIPNFYDTPETAEAQWQLIQDIIGAAITTGRTKMYEGGVPETPAYLQLEGGE